VPAQPEDVEFIGRFRPFTERCDDVAGLSVDEEYCSVEVGHTHGYDELDIFGSRSVSV
jgi:hypothetical protein